MEMGCESKVGACKETGLRETFGLENGSAAFPTAPPEEGELGLRKKPGAADRVGLERGCQK